VVTGRIFNIQRFSVQDGPGIRTTVFMKGCPLVCPWCSNPESQRRGPELGHIDSLCNDCGLCLEACDRDAISLAEKKISVDRRACDDCGRCVEVCTPGALKMFGRESSLDEVFAEIRRDELYYRNSGGGVTASGGEPLRQARFVAALFERCRSAGIHTALDTCGYSPRPELEKVLEHTDLVLFDLKLIDGQTHLEMVEVPNDGILGNARAVMEWGVPLLVRIPLIPGVTDTDENLGEAVRFVRQLGEGVRAVNLLPYHRFGLSKYQMLDSECPLDGLLPPSEEKLRGIVERFESLNLECEIIT
jgi:pyruvate formate lyase activating enzyme